jgi:hypothetical protein
MDSLSTLLEVTFVAGPVASPQEGQDLGCVWMETKAPQSNDGNNEVVSYGVRLIRQWQESQGDNVSGRNVEQLELDVELLQSALRDLLTSAGHDFFVIAGLAIDYDNQWVEAALTAYQRNLGTRGG